MKTIGILGGMSAASTQLYYQQLCNMTRDLLGGLHSPELLIRSVDFAEIEQLQMSNDWQAAGDRLNTEARRLEQGGAHLILIATNTMHKLANEIMHGLSIPMIHIADATAKRINQAGLRRPGLMATRFTMEETFYTQRLSDCGIDALTPAHKDRLSTHEIIYSQLCKGIVTDESRQEYIDIADRLVGSGADCLILGCTEVGMLLNERNVNVPVFDTTRIHCEAALEFAMDGYKQLIRE